MGKIPVQKGSIKIPKTCKNTYYWDKAAERQKEVNMVRDNQTPVLKTPYGK